MNSDDLAIFSIIAMLASAIITTIGAIIAAIITGASDIIANIINAILSNKTQNKDLAEEFSLLFIWIRKFLQKNLKKLVGSFFIILIIIIIAFIVCFSNENSICRINTPTPTSAPTSTRTTTPTSIPTETPLPPCNEQISITRPIENEQITAFRKQTGNLYWFETEGEYELCPLAENEEPQEWSILLITQLDSPKCILVQSFPLDEENSGKWNATIPIADTTIFGETAISRPIDLLLTTYLVHREDVEHLSTSSICKFDIEEYGLTNEYLENAISDKQNMQLIKLSK